MISPKNNFSENTVIQYSKVFTHIIPVGEDLCRFYSVKLAPQEVSYSEHKAFAGILKDNIIFIDIDNKEGNNEGTKEWKKLLIELDLDESLDLRTINTLVHTTKAGGYHVFFRLPKGCDKKGLPNSICKHIEIKKKDAYLSGSTVTAKEITGTYGIFRDCEVQELPSSLVMKLLSQKGSKKTKVKSEKEDHLYKIMEITTQGDNGVNWDDITYDDLKVKMETISPAVDYPLWQRQLYLFMAVYFKLQSLGKELDTSCEDFLAHWSSKGINGQKRDRSDIEGMVASFNLEDNQEDLLPENNYLIINYNSVTKFESYAKQFADEVEKLREESMPSGKIKAFVERYLDKLATSFVEDVMTNRECFVLDQDYETRIYNFYSFTINNRWEQIISNASAKKTRELIQLSPIYNILATEGRTLYSDNLRRHLAVILGNEELLNKFGQTLSFKLTTSLHRYDLSSKDFPFNTDIFGFKNLAVKVTKNPYSFKVISWEQVRALRLRKEILISTESVGTESAGDFFRKGVLFDSSILRALQKEDQDGKLKVRFDKMEEELFTLFAPLFWDLSVPFAYSQSEKDFEEEVINSTKARMKTFFHLIGKSILRYKATTVPFLFVVMGTEKMRILNGANGKTFLGQYLLTSLFGMSRVTLSGDTASEENNDKYTEAALQGAMLQIADDLVEKGSLNQVNIKHLIKKVGERRTKIRDMGTKNKDATSYYDTVVFANNVNKNIGADGGSARRLLSMVLYNANKLNVIKEYASSEEMLKVHKQRYDSYDPSDEDSTQEHFMNKYLNRAYHNFFNLPIVKKGLEERALADNIYFTYLESLGEVFAVNNSEVLSEEQVRLKSLLFFYSISGGNLLLQLGSVNHLTGLTPFIVEDKAAPLYNLLLKCFIFNNKFSFKKPEDIGVPLTRAALSKMLKKTVLTNTDLHDDEINRFVQQVPSVMVKVIGSVEETEMLNLVKFDLGLLNAELAKNDNLRLEAKIRSGFHTELNSVIEADVGRSPYKKSDKTKEQKIVELTKALGLKGFTELVEVCKIVKAKDDDNLWLKMYK